MIRKTCQMCLFSLVTLLLSCRLVYITYPIGVYHSHATHSTVPARLSHICLHLCSWTIIAINRYRRYYIVIFCLLSSIIVWLCPLQLTACIIVNHKVIDDRVPANLLRMAYLLIEHKYPPESRHKELSALIRIIFQIS